MRYVTRAPQFKFESGTARDASPALLRRMTALFLVTFILGLSSGCQSDSSSVDNLLGINPNLNSSSPSSSGGTPGVASQIALNGPSAITAGACLGYSLTSIDGSGNVAKVTNDTNFTLSATGSGQFYSDSNCSTPYTGGTLLSGSSAKTFYFSDPVAETSQLVGTSASLGNAVLSVTVSTAPAKKFIHSGQAYLQKGVCSNAFTISAVDASNNPYPAPSTTNITLTGTATTTFYSDSGCATDIGNTRTLAQNATSVTFYMKDSVAETVSLSYTSTGWTSGSGTVDIWGPLTITPTSKSLVVGNSSTFSGVGGAPPYTYSVVSGTGSINASSGVYTAPASPESDSLQVTDQVGNTATASITVVSSLAVAPTSRTILTGGNFTLTSSCPVSGNNICVSGGVPPYSYSIISGTGTVGSSNGIFVAPGSPESDTVRVTDSDGNTADLSVVVMPQPVVELKFDENANNWGLNTGSSNGTFARWGANGRAYPIFSSNVPSGTSSTHSLDFGDGTGWGTNTDGAVDLLEQGGLRGDYFANNTFATPSGGSRMDGPINFSYNAGVSPYPGAISGGFYTVRYLGRVLPSATSSYTFSFNDHTGDYGTLFGTIYVNQPSPGTYASSGSAKWGPSYTLATSSTAMTANAMVDYKMEFNNTESGSYYNEGYSLSWQSSASGPFPSLTIVGANYLWAPMFMSNLASLTKFTITGWLNNKSNTQDGTVILSWLKSAGGGVELRYRSDGSLQMGINEQTTATGTPRSSSGQITTEASGGASNWVFFAVTFDSTLSSNQVQFYFGKPGVPASADLNPTYASGPVGASVSELTLGNFNTTFLSAREAGTNVFRGIMDDIRIYDTALTQAQIRGVQTY